MTIILTPEQEREFWAEARENSQHNLSEPFESYCQVPKQLGKGYTRSIEVHTQVHLGIGNYEYYDDVLEAGCEYLHPLQFAMERAKRWLRKGNRTVLKVAIMTGYSNAIDFSVAFKRKFGIFSQSVFVARKVCLAII